jgi:DNA invertase Pin-like site-specific DNA recombinase
MGMLGQFFDDVRSGRIPRGDLLLTESFDRLSRDEPLKAFDLFRELVQCDIILVTGFLSDRPQIYSRERLKHEPEALHSVLGEMIRAHSESLMKSKRVADSHEEKRREGRENGTPIMGRTCPAWLDLSTDGKRYLVNEERAAIVRPSEAASGLGNLQIANRLNRNGIASFRPVIKDQQTKGWRQTKGWHTGTFRRSFRAKRSSAPSHRSDVSMASGWPTSRSRISSHVSSRTRCIGRPGKQS